MSPLDGLADLDWAAVSHAYGPATDVPDLLRDLQDADTAEGALDALYGNILHQGTYYPATSSALPFLAALACDPQTPARPALLAFVAEIGSMRPDGSHEDVLGLRGHYLPPDIDLDAFEATASTAFAVACAAILPCLDDADATVRAAVPAVWRCLAPLPADLAGALHGRLAIERDDDAIGAIAGRLSGQLTDAERATLAGAAPAARFAAACIALQSDRLLDPHDLATLRALWADCVPGFAGLSGARELLDGMLTNHKAAMLSLLDDLAATSDPAARGEAIVGYRTLARLSRGATDGAVEGLVRLTSRFTEHPGSGAAHDTLPAAVMEKLTGANTLTGAMRDLAAYRPDPAALDSSARRNLADALSELLATDRDGSRRVADALMALALAEPADLAMRAAEALLDAGDERWPELVAPAVTSGTPFASILKLTISAARRAGDEHALRATIDHVRDALRRDPAGSASLLWPLDDLPDAMVAPLLPEIVAALPFAARPACDLLSRWKRPDTLPALHAALANADAEARPWVHAALAAVTGDASEFDRGWALRTRFFDGHGYLSQWASQPTELFRETCRGMLTGTVSSQCDKHDQLLACRLMLPIDGIKGVWPTLRAIIDAGDAPMHEAVALAVATLMQAPDYAARAGLTTLLEDIRVNGRKNFRGNVLDAPVEAAIGLHALGAGEPAAFADTCLRTLRSSARGWMLSTTPDRACDLLVALARGDNAIRHATRISLAELLAADPRGWQTTDEAFQTMLRRAAQLFANQL